MMQLHHALDQIAEIRQQIDGAQLCRGYRSATAAFSAIVAALTAGAQALWLPQPWYNHHAYLYLWGSAALLCIAVVSVEMAMRYRRTESDLLRQTTLAAVEQFLPTLVAGALMTFVLAKSARPTLWILPGMWAILFSMGIFASWRVLPRPAVWVARYYLAAGLVCLGLAQDEWALSPWSMGLTFGLGQFMAAGVLYWKLERNHVRT